MRDLATLDQIVDELLGTPHSDTFDCWACVREILERGLGVRLDSSMDTAAVYVQEVWYRDTASLPLIAVVEPYDVLVFAVAGPLADHTGVVIDGVFFIHNRSRTGVCKERIERWARRCLQVVRLQTQASRLSASS